MGWWNLGRLLTGRTVLAVGILVMLSAATVAGLTSYSTSQARPQRNTVFDQAALDPKLNLQDQDGDQVPDVRENRLLSTDRLAKDSDGDGAPDAWEAAFGLNPNDAADGALDPDRDGLTNTQEYEASLKSLTAQGFSDTFDPAKGLSPLNPDSDGDQLPDGWEVQYGLDPLLASGLTADPDGDGLTNLQEYHAHSDPTKFDTDGDGLADGNEVNNLHTDPSLRDTDGDTMDDSWEVANKLDARNANDRFLDPDGDGLLNVQEYKAGTDPHQKDTDGDGIPDGWEVDYGLDPKNSADGHADPDADGLSNADEYGMRNSIYQQSTDPRRADTDGDGLLDGEESLYGTNPFRADTDLDGLTDGEEIHHYGTNPLTRDTDGDTLSDGDEIFVSLTNPLVQDSDSDGLADGDEYAYWTHRLELAKEELQSTGHIADFIRQAYPGGDQELLLKQLGPQGDPDKDGIPNILDEDSDGDSQYDGREVHLTAEECSTGGGSDPANPDTDGDRMPDGWEITYKLDPCNPKDAGEDPDGDGVVRFGIPDSNATVRVSPPNRPHPSAYAEPLLGGLPKYTNLMEYQNKTNPRSPDSDCDGMPDGWEVYFRRFDPHSKQLVPNPTSADANDDPDKDGYDYTGLNGQRDGRITDDENFTNLEEWYYFTDPWDNNTDHAVFHDPRNHDRVTFVGDGAEVYLGEDPEHNAGATVGLPGNGNLFLSSVLETKRVGGTQAGCYFRYDLMPVPSSSDTGPAPLLAIPPRAPPPGGAGGLPELPTAAALTALALLALRAAARARRRPAGQRPYSA